MLSDIYSFLSLSIRTFKEIFETEHSAMGGLSSGRLQGTKQTKPWNIDRIKFELIVHGNVDNVRVGLNIDQSLLKNMLSLKVNV